MSRTVDLVSYLPPFVSEYKEIRDTLTAENPEFNLYWDATDRVLKNEFISTADEYGISRFEKLLQIFPSREDTLETRRARVQARWATALPYTWRKLVEKLISICGENGFTITKDFLHYRFHLEVSLDIPGQVEELEHLLEATIPCNMVFTAANSIPCIAEGEVGVAGGICYVDEYFITNDGRESYDIAGEALQGGGLAGSVYVLITNDFNENFIINGSTDQTGKVVVDELIGANNIEGTEKDGRVQ